MAPSLNKKKNQPKITDILGAVTNGSPGLNMGSLPAKRGQSSNDQDSVMKKSKADTEPTWQYRQRATSEDNFGTGDESRGTSHTAGTRRPLTSNRASNTGRHVLGTPRTAQASAGDTGSLPSKILGPQPLLVGKVGKKEKSKENLTRDISSYFNPCVTSGSKEKGGKVSVDADVSSEGSGEFADPEMESFTEADLQGLEKQAVECFATGAVEGKFGESESEIEDISEEDFQALEDEAKLRLAHAAGCSKSAEGESPSDETEEGRIDGYISDVEDDGMELLIDEDFTQDEASAGKTGGRESAGSIGAFVPELEIPASEQKFFDRVSMICSRMCEFARMEKKYDSNKSPFAVKVWCWLRKATPEELAKLVFVRVIPEARVRFSADRIDVKSLLELPSPRLKILRDNCNNPGVTVIEDDLVASPRVIATLPRDEGSVSVESSQGLPSQGLVADIQHCLEGSLKYQPRVLNKALPARQGFKAGVRVARKCENCEHNSSNYSVGFFTSQFTKATLCRRCLRKEQFERTRPELEDMGRTANRKIPRDERPFCENPSCKKKGSVSSWSMHHDDYLLCKPCKRVEVDEFENSIFQSEYGTEGPPVESGLFCPGSSGSLCNDPRQSDKKSVKWSRSLVALAAGNEIWLCQSCNNREMGSGPGKRAQKSLWELKESGVVVPGLPRMAIPDEKKYCHNPECPKLRKSGERKKLERSDRPGWSDDRSHPQWILCGPCKESEKKRLVREILARRGIDVDSRRLRINQKDKRCTEEGCKDPLQEALKARMQAGEISEYGHIWYRHPVEKEGRVLCAPCRKAVLEKMHTEANRRARERINNPVLAPKKK
ncbi:hypothetical protein FLAG1_07246 [Fusarium langsethiae]|uniref:Uncharacterized protein n=1 Tax=Fusarium langsethiae TaxID=179993 RepID=A0A0M9EU18_FUSLA|nr:hypothetical protein FLAG1_07246 [Fusarium langsethiae]